MHIFEYGFIPTAHLKWSALTRRFDGPDSKVELLSYPYYPTLGILQSHLEPHFAIVNAARKLTHYATDYHDAPRFVAEIFGLEPSKGEEYVAKIHHLYQKWTSGPVSEAQLALDNDIKDDPINISPNENRKRRQSDITENGTVNLYPTVKPGRNCKSRRLSGFLDTVPNLHDGASLPVISSRSSGELGSSEDCQLMKNARSRSDSVKQSAHQNPHNTLSAYEIEARKKIEDEIYAWMANIVDTKVCP